MKLSRDAEERYLAIIRRVPAACVYISEPGKPGKPRLGQGPYTRPDGSLMVYRGNTQERLHRRFYRLLIDPKLGRAQLERTCPTWGCFNPHHYERTAETLRSPAADDSCPNGHPYTAENLTPAGTCATCLEQHRERRRTHRPTVAALNAAKTACPRNHPYTPENTYLFTDSRGRVHRKCRACARTPSPGKEP